MSDKSYSNCPLKKRPVQVVDNAASDLDDEESQPVDLSAPRRCENYEQTARSPDSVLRSPALVDYDRDVPKHFGLSKFAYPGDVHYLMRPDENQGLSPLSLRESSVSPPVIPASTYHSGYPQHQFFLNHNNNLVKDDQYQHEYRPIVSPALSHSTHSDLVSTYSEPEDLSVRTNEKTILVTDSRNNIQRTRKEQSDRFGAREDLYYQCSTCKKCYSTPAGLIKHEQCHALPQDLSKTKFAENSVISRSDRANESKGQISSKPHGAPRYQCSDCGKSYSTYSGLTKHQQFHCPAAEGNQAKKFFSCKNCDKVYVSLGALKMHIRTHTLPCKCPLCGKAFSRPWLLQGHIRTHTGEKPFSCQHCHRAFADRSNLRAHLQTHSDVKKYSCSSCAKTFSRMSLLGKHLQGGCPGSNPIGHSISMDQINCDYTASEQTMYYKPALSSSYPGMQEANFAIHQKYPAADHQHYKEDLHVY